MTITQDATSLWYIPANATECTALLTGTGIPNPNYLYRFQEASGHLVDSIGGNTSALESLVTYQVVIAGWSTFGIKCTTDGSASAIIISTPNASTNSLTAVQIFSIGTNPASGERALNCMGVTNYEEAQLIHGTTHPKVRAHSGGTADSSGEYSGVIVVVTKYDRTNSIFKVYLDDGTIITPTYTAQNADVTTCLLGDNFSSSDSACLYSWVYTGSNAELSDGNVSTIMSRIKSGPPAGSGYPRGRSVNNGGLGSGAARSRIVNSRGVPYAQAA